MGVSLQLCAFVPGFLRSERIRQIEHPAIRGVDDALPIAAPRTTLGCQTTDGFPADVGPTGGRRFRECTHNIVNAADSMIEDTSGIERLKYAFGAKLPEAGINFKEALPGVQKLF